MYKLKYWISGELTSTRFDTLHEAIQYSIYNIPFQSFYGIDLIKE